MQAALQHSVPLKKAELAVNSLSIWGRITALNGRDYIIAQSTPEPHMRNGKPVIQSLYFISQDGIRWSDLPAAEEGQREVACKMTDTLRGDPTHKCYWPPKPEDEEEEAGEPGVVTHALRHS